MIERKVADWVKRAIRNRMSVTGLAYRPDGTSIRVHMTNLSYDGCKLLTDKPLVIGEQVRLVVPGMQPILAQVRWTTNEEAGMRLLGGSAAEDRRARIGV